MIHWNARLDFEQFDISGPINSCEADSQGCAAWVNTGIADGGGCTVDKMAVKGKNFMRPRFSFDNFKDIKCWNSIFD